MEISGLLDRKFDIEKIVLTKIPYTKLLIN